MSEENQCADACNSGPGRKVYKFAEFRHRISRWLFLNIWCRHCYRPVMRLMHRFNLHYAPPSPMSPQFGRRDHWCQWCGLRGESLNLRHSDRLDLIPHPEGDKEP
jgi:hypothetical protein